MRLLDVFVFFVGIGEMPPDVAQRRRAEQRIGDRMQQHIRIGVSEQTLVIGYLHTADNELAACNQLMDVVTLANSHFIFL